MSEDKLYYVQYTGNEVVNLGTAGKFMPGTSAYLREADARAAAARGDFVVQGLDGSAASSSSAAQTTPGAASSSPTPAPAPPAAPPPKTEKKEEAKPEARPEAK